MSSNTSANEAIPAKHSRVAVAARYAAVIFGAIAGSWFLKLLLRRIFAMPPDDRLAGPLILALIAALFWFVVSFLALMRAGSGNAASRQEHNSSPTRTRTVLRTITHALVVAILLAISAWTGLFLNDEILESRSLPWIAPLITVQYYGFAKASRMFPCQIEGADTGCEAYKWIPTFLATNSLFYFPFVLIMVFCYQHSEESEQ